MCFWFVHIFLLRLLPSAIVTHCFHMCDRCHPCHIMCPLPWNPYPFASRLILPLICCTSCMHYFISLTTDTSYQRTESYWGHKAVCANGDKDKRHVWDHQQNIVIIDIVTPKMHLFHTCTKSPHKDTLIHVLLHVFKFGFAAALYLFAVIPISLWFPCIYFRKAKSQKKCVIKLAEMFSLYPWALPIGLKLRWEALSDTLQFFFHRCLLMMCTVHEDNLNMSFCDCFCGPPYCCALLNEGKNRGEN